MTIVSNFSILISSRVTYLVKVFTILFLEPGEQCEDECLHDGTEAGLQGYVMRIEQIEDSGLITAGSLYS